MQLPTSPSKSAPDTGGDAALDEPPEWSRGPRRRPRPSAREPSAVDRALEWLAAQQHPDGSWGEDGRPGATGLVLLAFVGAGETHNSGQYKDTIKAGLRFLKDAQGDDGRFGRCASSDDLYENMWAALAMSEAYGLTGSHLFKKPAQAGVDFILAARNPGLGWGDGPRDRATNSSMTIWAVMVLKSAQMAELNVDEEAFQGAVAWLDLVTDPDSGHVGHSSREDAGDDRPFPALSGNALVAGAIVARTIAGADPRESDVIQKGADLLLADPPTANSADPAHWYFGTLAMFYRGRGDWKAWEELVRAAIPAQHTDDSETSGSWTPPEDATRSDARISSTALRTLVLEISYDWYKRVFRDDDDR